MITADTITDEQIRELQREKAKSPVVRLCVIATAPVGATVNGEYIDVAYRQSARARCAEILNARAKERQP